MCATTNEKPLILFDGYCLLCRSTVRFILKHDKKKQFLFAPLQGNTAKHYIKEHSSKESIASVWLIEAEKIYTHSSAALRIARRLRFPINLCYAFIVVPRPVRDFVYNYISRNRYNWFGKSDACMIPTADVAARFLD